ncbi:MAG: hypothetical protein ACI4Q3_07165 [Kiritimatiellia bacterium]
MKIVRKTLPALIALLSLTSAATSRELSLAVEDAARTTVKSLAADARVKGVKSIAFVKLKLPEGNGALALDSNASQVYEAVLASTAQNFVFVTHDTHVEEWKLIDGIFDQAADFASYDPRTHPELKKLKLADALLFGQVIDCTVDERSDDRQESCETSLRIALRLLKISTGEQIWGNVVNGKCVTTKPIRQRNMRKELKKNCLDLLTFRNVLIALGAIVAIVVGFVLIGRMTRVR